MTARFKAVDYRTAFQALMPRGPVWPRDPDAVQTKVIDGLVQSYERSDAAAGQLLVEAFPATTTAMLEEWESSLGLPDPQAGQAPIIEKRRRAVVSRLVGSYGASAAGLKAFAAVFGFNLTISTFAPFRAGQSSAGHPAASEAWAFAFAIGLTPMADPPFSDPIGDWDKAFVTAGLRRIAPAHQTLVLLPT